MLKVVCISDTHSKHKELIVPDGDVLIHAGDFTYFGSSIKEVESFNTWLGKLPHKHKIVIAGNHDVTFEVNPRRTIGELEVKHMESLLTNCVYLNDSGITIDGVNFWGSPITPWFFDWAFNRMRGKDIKKHWNMIPDNTNVLITHGPPLGVLDRVGPRLTGCEDLMNRIEHLQHLKLHVFGHIHCGYGTQDLYGVKFVNAAVVGENYQLTGKPIRIVEV
jgi:Icc-related predicted phosphoesterase